MVTGAKDTKRIFQKYYANLYKWSVIEISRIEKYLEKLEYVDCNEKIVKQMNQPITQEEVVAAIQKLKNHKSLGPDGYTAGFYKLNKKQNSGILTSVMNQFMERQQLPDTWREGNITLILKESTDLKDQKNCRPIFLSNVDYKIFAAILAK